MNLTVTQMLLMRMAAKEMNVRIKTHPMYESKVSKLIFDGQKWMYGERAYPRCPVGVRRKR